MGLYGVPAGLFYMIAFVKRSISPFQSKWCATGATTRKGPGHPISWRKYRTVHGLYDAISNPVTSPITRILQAILVYEEEPGEASFLMACETHRAAHFGDYFCFQSCLLQILFGDRPMASTSQILCPRSSELGRVCFAPQLAPSLGLLGPMHHLPPPFE